MTPFKLFNNFNAKKKIALIGLLILALLLILGKNYIIKEAREVAKVPSIRIHLINMGEGVDPIKHDVRPISCVPFLLQHQSSCRLSNCLKIILLRGRRNRGNGVACLISKARHTINMYLLSGISWNTLRSSVFNILVHILAPHRASLSSRPLSSRPRRETCFDQQ